MARVLLLLSSTLCCLALFVLPSPGAAAVQGADGVVYAAAPEERGAYRVVAHGGKAGHFGYNTGDGIARVEVRRDDGSVVGSYRYYDPYGKQVVRSYIADDQGFRVLGNDLPISLDTPVYKVEGAPALTGAVEGTQDYDIPPPLSPGSARTVQPGSLRQSISEQYALKPLPRADDQLVQLLAAPADGLQSQVLREQQEIQAQQLQQMQELQAGLIAQQQLNIQKQAQTIAQQQAKYGGPVKNELTGGHISPYYEYPRDLPFDFPAGFAYPGEPIVRQPVADPVATPRPYIIGKRDPIQSSVVGRNSQKLPLEEEEEEETPEPTTSTSTTTTTLAPPVTGDDPAHPEVDIIPGRSQSELSTHAPVAPHKGDDPDHPEVDITAGHTHNEASTLPPAAPHKDFRPVDDKITAGHTHSEKLKQEPVGHLREVNHVSENTIPSSHASHNSVSQLDLIISPALLKPTAIHDPNPISTRPLWNYNDYSPVGDVREVNHVSENTIPSSHSSHNSVSQLDLIISPALLRPTALHDPNPISTRPLWNYNDYSTSSNRNSYNAVQRPIVRRDRNRISQQPLWNYGKNPYVRRQSYERIRPISGRPRLPHCPGWCPY